MSEEKKPTHNFNIEHTKDFEIGPDQGWGMFHVDIVPNENAPWEMNVAIDTSCNLLLEVFEELKADIDGAIINEIKATLTEKEQIDQSDLVRCITTGIMNVNLQIAMYDSAIDIVSKISPHFIEDNNLTEHGEIMRLFGFPIANSIGIQIQVKNQTTLHVELDLFCDADSFIVQMYTGIAPTSKHQTSYTKH